MNNNFTDRFIYSGSQPDVTHYDAARYNLGMENQIKSRWNEVKSQRQMIRNVTCGLSYFFENQMSSPLELRTKINHYRRISLRMDVAARKIQNAYIRHRFKNDRAVADRMRKFQGAQIGSSLSICKELVSTWLTSGIDIFSGPRGQVIWQKMTTMNQELKSSGFYTFIHAHSYPITLHLDLATHLQSMHHSEKYLNYRPLSSRVKFRAPGVAEQYKNTSEYLQSPIGRAINGGRSIDDRHRETIISCDAIVQNNQPFESAQHFFKSNKSIVDTNSSTGMKENNFDRYFLKDFLHNEHLLNYGVELFSKARMGLKQLPGYGKIRIIAIRKDTLLAERTSYIWRSHAFGVICTCRHQPDKYGHQEFATTLDKNQKGEVKRCKTQGNPLPQYRILAANLDKDNSKHVFDIDCLNSQEKNDYQRTNAALLGKIEHLVKFENLKNCKTYDDLLDLLKEIRLRETYPSYHKGVSEVLNQNKDLIESHWEVLKMDLQPNKCHYLRARLPQLN